MLPEVVPAELLELEFELVDEAPSVPRTIALSDVMFGFVPKATTNSSLGTPVATSTLVNVA